jgi:putative flippase GtrA
LLIGPPVIERAEPAGPRRAESIRQLLSYAAVGVANTGVGYGVIFAAMYVLGWTPVASNVLGYAVGVVVSYALNRRFTFRSERASGREFLRFVAVLLVAYLANLATLIVLVDHVAIHPGAAQVVAGVVYFAVSFLLSRRYAFAGAKVRRPS